MPIRWTADSTTVTIDNLNLETVDYAGPDPDPNSPGKHPKFIGGGAGGDGSVLFPGISLETKPLRGPRRLRARVTIDPSPIPIPSISR